MANEVWKLEEKRAIKSSDVALGMGQSLCERQEAANEIIKKKVQESIQLT